MEGFLNEEEDQRGIKPCRSSDLSLESPIQSKRSFDIVRKDIVQAEGEHRTISMAGTAFKRHKTHTIINLTLPEQLNVEARKGITTLLRSFENWTTRDNEVIERSPRDPGQSLPLF